ncbi:EamA family transporter [Deinococcus sp. KNUC1210]|uniref:EamA family transporter n=1 Tax=Deinococcus sp. KNUC1210 TaxID=2917691 RepID=UPI001EEFFFF9|nr:EamA family transporter [Deinococcus sp. KNUC1210]ULH14760.1 EamA family transporter [Deinococcus sp. KNUC1210]
MPLRAFLLALFVTFIWGVNFVVIKLSVDGAPPLLVAALRFTLAALPAVFFVRRPAVPLKLLVGYGLTVGVVQFGLLYVAVQLGLSAGLASLLMQMQAFLTALLSAWLLKERLLPNQIAGMGLAFVGMALIGASGSHQGGVLSFGLVLLAALGWAFSNLQVRQAGGADVIGLVVWSSLVSPLPLLLGSGLLSGWGPTLHALTHGSLGFWGGVAFMGYFNTVLGFGLWSRLIQQYGAARVAPLSLMVPVFGLLSSALYFHETFPALKVAAALLVFAGLLLHVFGGRWLGTQSSAASRSQGQRPL